MKKNFYAIAAAAALTLAMTSSASTQEKAAPAKKPMAEKHENMEQHPQIAAAMQHLREARETLDKAPHDFGGHRAKALKHINEALEECRQALAFDKK